MTILESILITILVMFIIILVLFILFISKLIKQGWIRIGFESFIKNNSLISELTNFDNK